MKTVALIPFKNEAKLLPSFLSTITKVCDAIVAVDDGSTDNGASIIKSYESPSFEVHILNSENSEDWTVHTIRQHLLDVGREIGGTHFVCLDADETFTAPFLENHMRVMERMSPGDKILMQWLAMWKSSDHYREDSSVWSNNFKDFIFCDDGKSSAHIVYFCEGRTPGDTKENLNAFRLNPKYGAVIHWQFSDFKAFQAKQSWYRCRELAAGRHFSQINEKYRITLDDENALVKPLPESWLENIVVPEFKMTDHYTDWRLKEIESLFRKLGPEKFAHLNIWHVPEIEELRRSLANG